MLFAALVDAGLVGLTEVRRHVSRVGLPPFKMMARRERVPGGRATRVSVMGGSRRVVGQPSEAVHLISNMGLGKGAETMAAETYRLLGEAEAQVHDVPLEAVHFHEVGSLTNLVCIVGSALAFGKCSRMYSTPLNTGTGRINTSHGEMDVPAPATSALLSNVPNFSDGTPGELASPTGTALLKAMDVSFVTRRSGTWRAVGRGMDPVPAGSVGWVTIYR